MTPQTAMQRRTGEVWEGRLEGVETVVEGQQGVAAEGYDEGFLVLAEKCRARLSGSCLVVFDGVSLSPFLDGLGVDAVGLLSSLSEAFDHCMAFLTACVVVALP